jgi:hypothetical protein
LIRKTKIVKGCVFVLKKLIDTVYEVVKGSIFMALAVALIYFFIGILDKKMIMGLLFGTIFAILNFVLLASTLNKAVRMDSAKAQVYAGSRYYIRYLLTGIVIYISIKSPNMNVYGAISGLIIPKFYILLSNLFGYRKKVELNSVRKEVK